MSEVDPNTAPQQPPPPPANVDAQTQWDAAVADADQQNGQSGRTERTADGRNGAATSPPPRPSDRWAVQNGLLPPGLQELQTPAANDAPEQPTLPRAELERRADAIKQRYDDNGVFGLTSQDTGYDEIAGEIEDLTPADAQALREVYRQRTGGDLLSDTTAELGSTYERFRALSKLDPDSVRPQLAPVEPNGRQPGITSTAPQGTLATGSQVEYGVALAPYLTAPGQQPTVRAIAVNDPAAVARGEVAEVAELGEGRVSATAKATGTHQIIYEVQFGDQPPQYYTYRQQVSTPQQLAQDALAQLQAAPPQPQLLKQGLAEQIGRGEQQLARLKADPGADGGATRTLEAQLDRLREAQREAQAELAEGAVGEALPIRSVLIAEDNSAAVPLQLYAKPLGDNRWQIVDLTDPRNARSYDGQGATPEEGLQNAWQDFIDKNNLPAGQIAARPPQLPPGYQRPEGFPEQLELDAEDPRWNQQSDGASGFKAWSDGLGIGSMALAALGVGALLAAPFTGGATAPAAPWLFGAAGLSGAAASGLNIADRVDNGNFELFSGETALDVLGVVGGVAGGASSISTIARSGTTTIRAANGLRFTIDKADEAGRFLKIASYVDEGAEAASGIIIGREYLKQIEEISNDPGLSDEEKRQRTEAVMRQAALHGGLMVLGSGLGNTATRRLAEPVQEATTARANRVSEIFGEQTLRRLDGGLNLNRLESIAENIDSLPRSWSKFDPDGNPAFAIKLEDFRGNNKLTPDYSGGEGKIFISPTNEGLALKRWNQARIGDMDESVRLLEDTRRAVGADPNLARDVEVVRIHERGDDWIVRDFDPDSTELKNALADPDVAAARQRLLDALQNSDNPNLQDLYKKLLREPPSANLHWSPTQQKLLVIDMM